MSPIGTIRNKLAYAGAKGAETARTAAVRAVSRKGKASYSYEEPRGDILVMQETVSQRMLEGESPAAVLGSSFSLRGDVAPPLFSIFISVREPDLRLFRSTVTSVLEQTYTSFELYILDQGISGQVRDVIAWYREDRLHYVDISDGNGPAAMFNRTAAQAGGDYILKLECGDLLTRDALFEAALAIMQTDAEILYADEDRRDAGGKHFSDPWFKPDFSIDYLYAVDYVSRMMLVRRSLFLAIRFRDGYEEAPEYDFVLRAPKSAIYHVPRVLCHVYRKGNPSPETTECRKKALEDFFRLRGVRASVRISRMPGILEIDYIPDIFTARRTVGIVGGKVLDKKHRIIGGMMDEKGNLMFRGWDEAEEGPRQIAQTVRNAWALDVRCMKIRPELQGLYKEVFGCSYEGHVMHRGDQLEDLSLEFCARVRELGYTLVWNPMLRRIERA